jgi:hypothetical protein
MVETASGSIGLLSSETMPQIPHMMDYPRDTLFFGRLAELFIQGNLPSGTG